VVVHEAREERGDPEISVPVVVLVHGSLDRGASFLRVVRRLPDARTVLYDRRGYQQSRAAGPTGIAGHVDDLVELLERCRGDGTHHDGAARLYAVGHSYGGDVALGAAARRPDLLTAVGVYEPPLPWLGFGSPRRRRPEPDPARHAESFFRRMMGDGAWERLSPAARASREADGSALSTELRSIREGTPFEVHDLEVPVVVARGGTASAPHHLAGTQWLAQQLARGELYEIPAAAHGAHLSHPDAFARFVRRVMAHPARNHQGNSRAEPARRSA
jgi:pimeloyl-ACP methyl ester carboxylesterase